MKRRFIHLSLILALLLGSALPLLQAAAASQGFWTTSCTGEALFVPTSADDTGEHVRCLLCLADSNDDDTITGPVFTLASPSGHGHWRKVGADPVVNKAAGQPRIRAPPRHPIAS